MTFMRNEESNTLFSYEPHRVLHTSYVLLNYVKLTVIFCFDRW